MKIEQTIRVDYDEVNTDFRMKLAVLFRRLQRAALHHSESVGLGSAAMVTAGAVWILNRIRVDIQRMPVYGEEISIRTWHKGSAGFRAGRDFLVLSGGEKVAAASSLWLYYDLNRQRIAKIPERVSAPYTAEADEALEAGAIDFQVDKTFEPDQTMTITTREGDYDPNGHVNNTAYLEYLDTLVKRTRIGLDRAGQVGIQYIQEIGQDVHTIQAGVAAGKKTAWFRFFNQANIYAAGFITAPNATVK